MKLLASLLGFRRNRPLMPLSTAGAQSHATRPPTLAVAPAPAWINIASMGDLPPFIGIYPDNSEVGRIVGAEKAILVLEMPGQRSMVLVAAESGIDSVLSIINNLDLHFKINAPAAPLWAKCSKTLIQSLVGNSKNGSKQLHSLPKNAGLMLWESWVDAAVRADATDMHVKIEGSLAHVEIRVHGVIEPLQGTERGVFTAGQALDAVSSVFAENSVMRSNSNNLFSPNGNDYAMFNPQWVGKTAIAVRFQSVCGAFGTHCSARLLRVNADMPTPSFVELGYEPSQIEMMRHVTRLSTGMVILAGATGGGKTTTARAFITAHPSLGEMVIYSVEDPVEYQLKGVFQIAVQRDIADSAAGANSFNSVLLALLRKDPDMVFMGELRDAATAQAAQQVAISGHFLLGTLHANSLGAIVPRLCGEQIGMSRESITTPGMLAFASYQGLVPVLCAHCRINGVDTDSFGCIRGAANEAPESTAADVNDVLGQVEHFFNLPPKLFNFQRKGGCPLCHGRGTSGLRVAAEMMIPDQKWLELVRSGDDFAAQAWFDSQSDGDPSSGNMRGKTVFHHALLHSQRGLVDLRACLAFGDMQTASDRLKKGGHPCS